MPEKPDWYESVKVAYEFINEVVDIADESKLEKIHSETGIDYLDVQEDLYNLLTSVDPDTIKLHE